MPRLVERHPWPTRVLHWANVPVMAVMVWSGLGISAAKEPYTIAIAGRTLVTLFPAEFFRTLDMQDPPNAIGWHFAFVWLLGLIGLSYLTWTFASGCWRRLLPQRGSGRDAWDVLLRDLGVRKTPSPPRNGYNGAQRIAYTMAIALGIGLGLTGLAIFRPTQFSFLVWMLGGYPVARAIHFWLTIAMVLFVAIHVLQVARAGWNTLRSMIIGVEVVDETKVPHVES